MQTTPGSSDGGWRMTQAWHGRLVRAGWFPSGEGSRLWIRKLRHRRPTLIAERRWPRPQWVASLPGTVPLPGIIGYSCSRTLRSAAIPRAVWLFTAPRLIPIVLAMSASDRSP